MVHDDHRLSLATHERVVPHISMTVALVLVAHDPVGSQRRRKPCRGQEGCVTRCVNPRPEIDIADEQVVDEAQQCAGMGDVIDAIDVERFVDAVEVCVVTRNVDDFKPTGVEILNPWEWEPER